MSVYSSSILNWHILHFCSNSLYKLIVSKSCDDRRRSVIVGLASKSSVLLGVATSTLFGNGPSPFCCWNRFEPSPRGNANSCGSFRIILPDVMSRPKPSYNQRTRNPSKHSFFFQGKIQKFNNKKSRWIVNTYVMWKSIAWMDRSSCPFGRIRSPGDRTVRLWFPVQFSFHSNTIGQTWIGNERMES